MGMQPFSQHCCGMGMFIDWQMWAALVSMCSKSVAA